MNGISSVISGPQPDGTQGIASVHFKDGNKVIKTLPSCGVYIPHDDESVINTLYLNIKSCSKTTYLYVLGPWFEDIRPDMSTFTNVTIRFHHFRDPINPKTFQVTKRDFSEWVEEKFHNSHYFLIPCLQENQNKTSDFLKRWSSKIVLCRTPKDICSIYHNFCFFGQSTFSIQPQLNVRRSLRKKRRSSQIDISTYKTCGFRIHWNKEGTECYMRKDVNQDLYDSGVILISDKGPYHCQRAVGCYKKENDSIKIYSFLSDEAFIVPQSSSESTLACNPQTHEEPRSLRNAARTESTSARNKMAQSPLSPPMSSPPPPPTPTQTNISESNPVRVAEKCPGHTLVTQPQSSPPHLPPPSSPQKLPIISEQDTAQSTGQKTVQTPTTFAGQDHSGQIPGVQHAIDMHQRPQYLLQSPDQSVVLKIRNCSKSMKTGNEQKQEQLKIYSDSAVFMRRKDRPQSGETGRLSFVEAEFNNLLLELPRRISTDWKIVGLHLGLKDYDLSSIEDDNRRTQDKASQMLTKWKELKGDKATPSKLADALRNADRNDLGDVVQQFAIIGRYKFND